MEREEVLSEMRNRIGGTSLSDRTLGDYVDANLPEAGNEPDDAYWEKHVNFLKSLSGNFSHDIKEYVEKWKSEHPEKQDDKNKNDAAHSELEERLKRLETELADARNEHKRHDTTKRLIEEGNKIKVANTAIWQDVVSGMNPEKEETFDALLKRAKEKYEEKLHAYLGDGALPYSRKGVAREEDEKTYKARREAFFEKLHSRDAKKKAEK